MPGHQAEQHNAQALHSLQLGPGRGSCCLPSCGPTFQSPLGTWEGIVCLLCHTDGDTGTAGRPSTDPRGGTGHTGSSGRAKGGLLTSQPAEGHKGERGRVEGTCRGPECRSCALQDTHRVEEPNPRKVHPLLPLVRVQLGDPGCPCLCPRADFSWKGAPGLLGARRTATDRSCTRCLLQGTFQIPRPIPLTPLPQQWCLPIC